MATTGLVVLDDEGEDEQLLSVVAAAEASALASKRRKTSPSSTPAGASSGGGGGGRGGGMNVEEGSYMAALRGSRSALWQQQQQQRQGGREGFKSSGGGHGAGAGASAAGSCFKCGQSGHWARDCTGGSGGNAEPPPGRAVGAGGLEAEGDVPGKPCPCGQGDCLVLTSNTARNPGRKFYRCPLREENGGCNFFEWCDNPSSGIPASRCSSNYSSSVPELSCPCGAGSCLVLTAKTGKNIGQQFYRCPLDQGAGSCGFFKWCNQYKSSADPGATESLCSTPNNTKYEPPGGRSSSDCFKCGQVGHWAKDCPKNELDSHTSLGGKTFAASGSCFKCGQVGHWARDCSAQNTTFSAAHRKGSDTSRGSYLGKSR